MLLNENRFFVKEAMAATTNKYKYKCKMWICASVHRIKLYSTEFSAYITIVVLVFHSRWKLPISFVYINA